jgi:hypothetical protein
MGKSTFRMRNKWLAFTAGKPAKVVERSHHPHFFMKLIFSKILILACITANLFPLVAADDIFSASEKTEKSDSPSYSTSAAFLSATKNGEIPQLLLDTYASKQYDAIGKSVIEVLQHDYKVPAQKRRFDIPLVCGLLLQNLTEYEINGHDPQRADSFKNNRKVLAQDCSDEPKFVEAFDAFAREYARAVREYAASKKDNQEQHEAAVAKQ